jgi:hypothetical protein
MNLPKAEDINYWKTGKSSAESWLDKTQAMIEKHDGRVVRRLQGVADGLSAILFVFELDGEQFKIVWPVLETRAGDVDTPAARRQAATFVYHDVKARLLSRQVWGARKAFMAYLLPEGSTRNLMEMGDEDVSHLLPDLR